MPSPHAHVFWVQSLLHVFMRRCCSKAHTHPHKTHYTAAADWGLNLCCVSCASPCVCARVQRRTSVLYVVHPSTCMLLFKATLCLRACFVSAGVRVRSCKAVSCRIILRPGALVLLPIACVSTEPVMLGHRCVLVLFCWRMAPAPAFAAPAFHVLLQGRILWSPAGMVSADTICDDHIRRACPSVSPVCGVCQWDGGGGLMAALPCLSSARCFGAKHTVHLGGCFGRFCVYLVAALDAGFDRPAACTHAC